MHATYDIMIFFRGCHHHAHHSRHKAISNPNCCDNWLFIPAIMFFFSRPSYVWQKMFHCWLLPRVRTKNNPIVECQPFSIALGSSGLWSCQLQFTTTPWCHHHAKCGHRRYICHLPSIMFVHHYTKSWCHHVIHQYSPCDARYMMCITAFPFRFFPCFIFLLGCLLIIIVESGVISDKFLGAKLGWRRWRGVQNTLVEPTQMMGFTRKTADLSSENGDFTAKQMWFKPGRRTILWAELVCSSKNTWYWFLQNRIDIPSAPGFLMVKSGVFLWRPFQNLSSNAWWVLSAENSGATCFQLMVSGAPGPQVGRDWCQGGSVWWYRLYIMVVPLKDRETNCHCFARNLTFISWIHFCNFFGVALHSYI